MAKPIPYVEFLQWFFSGYESTFVFSSADSKYTQLQKGLLDGFLLSFEGNAKEETEELRAITAKTEQVFVAPPSPFRCEGLYAFHLGPKSGSKLSAQSKKLLEVVYTNFPEAKATGVLMIHGEARQDEVERVASTKGKKALDKLLASIHQPVAKKTASNKRKVAA